MEEGVQIPRREGRMNEDAIVGRISEIPLTEGRTPSILQSKKRRKGEHKQVCFGWVGQINGQITTFVSVSANIRCRTVPEPYKRRLKDGAANSLFGYNLMEGKSAPKNEE